MKWESDFGRGFCDYVNLVGEEFELRRYDMRNK